MSWLFAVLLALFAFAALLLLRAPRKGWEALAAALLVGIAGYGLQASPGLVGMPKTPVERIDGGAAAMVEARRSLGSRAAQPGSHLTIADALARNGRNADAAEVLRGATDRNPKDAEAWLAMANALVGHAEGQITPAAMLAFRRAADAAPGHPGPPFFLGLALAQSGRLGEGRTVWAQLLAATPAEAPWRGELAERLARLDAFIAAQTGREGAQ